MTTPPTEQYHLLIMIEKICIIKDTKHTKVLTKQILKASTGAMQDKTTDKRNQVSDVTSHDYTTY
jgi:hypothetical protein